MSIACLIQEYRNSCYTANYQVQSGRPAQEIQGPVACKLQVMQPPSYKVGNSGQDRSAWREECYNVVIGFEEQRVNAAKARRAASKDRCHSASSTSATYTCDTCGRTCSSRITIQSPTKPSLRFAASTTHSMQTVWAYTIDSQGHIIIKLKLSIKLKHDCIITDKLAGSKM